MGDEAVHAQLIEQHLPLVNHVVLQVAVRFPKYVDRQELARAGALGLHRVAHAGEEGPPAYISDALDVLHVERIDHGVRCLEDPALVQQLARAEVPLTVCPLSNVKLCVFRDLAHHPLRTLLAKGLRATVNSDDPAYFGGYVNENFTQTFAALPLDAEDAYTLARNSFTASFADAGAQRRWIDRLNATFDAFGAH